METPQDLRVVLKFTIDMLCPAVVSRTSIVFVTIYAVTKNRTVDLIVNVLSSLSSTIIVMPIQKMGIKVATIAATIGMTLMSATPFQKQKTDF